MVKYWFQRRLVFSACGRSRNGFLEETAFSQGETADHRKYTKLTLCGLITLILVLSSLMQNMLYRRNVAVYVNRVS